MSKKGKENPDHINSSEEGLTPSGESIQKIDLGEEFLLVPADTYYSSDDRELIDLMGILKDLWINRKTIFSIALFFLLVGVFVYAGSERIYYSEAKLMPESSSGVGQVSQLFQQYENILGIQRSTDDDDIRVAMYPHIVESIPFQVELMQHEIYFSDIDQQLTIYNYFQDYYEKSLTEKSADVLWNATIGLPVTIFNFVTSVSSSDEVSREPVDFGELDNFDTPKRLDNRVREVATRMTNLITVIREPQTGFISIGVSLNDPHAATEMVLLIRNLLQEYVVEYRTEKALDNLNFIQEQFQEAKQQFQAAQDTLATFQDRNVNIQRQSVLVTEQRLQSEFDIAFNLYNTLARRLQEAKIQVQEQTPVFRTHEPPTVPGKPSSPSFARIIGGSVFAGLFLGVAFIYLRRGIKLFSRSFKSKEPKPYLS